MKLRSIKAVNVRGKKVLVRVDYNVPVKSGKVTDFERINSSLPTLNWLIDNGAIPIIVSHFGRPDGKKNKDYSLKFLTAIISKMLGKKVAFVPDCIGTKRDKMLSSAKPGDVFLLENVRFYAGEEKNDPDFSKQLAAGVDIFVNDAFSASHRAHASVVGVTKIIDSYAGFSQEKEVAYISEVLEKPKSPFVVVSGGAKISDKIDILRGLIESSDILIIGGAMANTFLAAEGYEVGKSLYEPDFERVADEIKRECDERGVELILPDDVVVAKNLKEGSKTKVKPIDEVEKNEYIVDIGPVSVGRYAEPIRFAGTVFWNGPVGISEHKNARGGTIGVAKIIAESKGHSIIGGGDTLAAVRDLKLKFDFVSTGGGATLEMLSGKELPGVKALLA